MTAVVGWAVEALIASTLLMMVVLLIRASARRQFGPQLAYMLWALPVLRLILPPLPTAWQALAASPIARAGDTITILVLDPAAAAVTGTAPAFSTTAFATTPVATGAAPGIGLVLAVLWIVGATVFFGWHLIRHTQFCRRMIATADMVDAIDGVRVIETDAAPGPLAFGLVRRYVAFPRDIDDRYDADERALALAHEIGHHQRGDLIANWIALVVLALHWFNPVAWRAFRAFRADQELANDARVLAGRSPIDRHHYACAIVKAAHGGAVSAACHLHTIDDLKGRLKMLTTSRTSRRRLVAGTACVSVLAATGLALTASGTSAAAAITTRVSETIVGSAVQMPPAPPAPPAALDAPSPPAAPARAISDEAAKTTVKHVVVKRVGKDGKLTTTSDSEGGFTDAETEAMVQRALAAAPEVHERNCTDADGGDHRQVTINRQDGDKRIMIVCTNRIDAITARAAKTAVQSVEVHRSAMKAAMAGITAARESILTDRNLSEAQRRAALSGLDEAIAEMRSEQAKDGV